MNKTFSIKEALQSAWQLTINNIFNFFVVGIISICIYAVSIIFSSISGSSLLNDVVDFLVTQFIMLGWVSIALTVRDTSTFSMNDFFARRNVYLSFITTTLITYILFVGGFILLVIPGIFLMVRLSFTMNIIADKGVNPLDAISESFRLTKGVFWKVFLINILYIGVCFLGVIALGIGLVVAIPVVYIADMYVYRTLEQAA